MLDRRGWQVMTHAIGDAAVRMALDAYEAAAKANPAPERGRRHRIEHIETIDPADIPRFGKLGVIASMQPVHATPSPTRATCGARTSAPERASRGWVWDSIAKAGGRLAFGSDWPVVTLDPLDGPARGGHPNDAGRPARGRLDARRAAAAAQGDRRLHARRRMGVVRRAAQGHARAATCSPTSSSCPTTSFQGPPAA